MRCAASCWAGARPRSRAPTSWGAGRSPRAWACSICPRCTTARCPRRSSAWPTPRAPRPWFGRPRRSPKTPAPPVSDVDVFQEVRAVQRQSKRLERLFANLLDVSNLNAGDLQLRPESVDLAAAVREILIGMREELAQAGCAVTFLAAAPVVGSWDRSRLDQIAINLLSNAAKYGRGKPVEVGVEQTGTPARLLLRDHGFGIAPA